MYTSPSAEPSGGLVANIGSWRFVAIVLAIAMIATVAVIAQPDDADALDDGVLFGSYARAVNGQTNIEAVEALEAQLGSKLPLVRTFSKWDEGIGEDKRMHRWARDGGRELMMTFVAERNNGQVIPWRNIANAQPGSTLYREIQELASGVRRFGVPVIVGFHHEPERGVNQEFGTAEEFKGAYRKIHQIFEAEGATNAQWAWIMGEWAFAVGEIRPNDRRRAELWYPGDDVVDYITSDDYNWNNCRPGTTTDPWISMREDLGPLMEFAREHPRQQLILGEFASDEGRSGQKAEWFDEIRSLFKSGEFKERFAAIVYFHDDGANQGWPGCEWWITSSQSSLEAARRIVADPFYRGDLPGVPAPTTTARPTTTTTRATTTTARPTTTTTRATTTTARPTTTTTRATTTTARPTTTTTARPTTTTTRATTTTARPTTTTVAPAAPASPANPTTTVRTAASVPPGITCAGRTVTIAGTSGDDVLTGTPGNDVFHGLGGNDQISGGGGDDLICGGDGNDRLVGARGNDTIYAGPGSDTVIGGHNDDTLYGGDGNDLIEGGAGRDLVYGESGRDTLLGGRGIDRIQGGGQDDFIDGRSGRDRLQGNGGNDRIDGGPGDDRLNGSEGNDDLRGGAGRDLLYGDAGNDRLEGGNSLRDSCTGGAGSDVLGITCDFLSP